jgi:hypothetical protein
VSTYEELTLIVNVAMLIIAILVYTNSKGTKNNHPAYQADGYFSLGIGKPLCGVGYLLYL